ncbi:phosphate acyltransferase PlsX [Candidatus Zixiibacteriota bacterium]
MTDNIHTIVLDVMGADSGVDNIVQGGIDAAVKFGERIKIILVGKEDIINNILSEKNDMPSNVVVKHAQDEVPMEMSATDGVRMKTSSIAAGLKIVKEKEAVAFISPGNTGAVMASSLLTLGRIEGVSRPAITALIPTSTGKPTVVLDVGANSDCKPHHLSQFAVMGSVYASVVLKVEYPRVGLLSIGEERSKGNELIFNAQEQLKNSRVNFIGNVEGRDILSGAIDVVVTDGFTGNIMLKFAESVKPLLVKSIQRQIQTNMFSRIGAILLLPFLRRMRNMFDYAEAGGAPLLGVNGIVIICHGSSNARAILNAISVAFEMAEKKIKQRIHDELITNHFGQNNGTENKSQNSRNGIVRTSASND